MGAAPWLPVYQTAPGRVSGATSEPLGGPTAVDDQDRSVDLAFGRGGQVGHRATDVSNSTDPAHRNVIDHRGRIYGIIESFNGAGCVGERGSNRVHRGTEWRPFRVRVPSASG